MSDMLPPQSLLPGCASVLLSKGREGRKIISLRAQGSQGFLSDGLPCMADMPCMDAECAFSGDDGGLSRLSLQGALFRADAGISGMQTRTKSVTFPHAPCCRRGSMCGAALLRRSSHRDELQRARRPCFPCLSQRRATTPSPRKLGSGLTFGAVGGEGSACVAGSCAWNRADSNAVGTTHTHTHTHTDASSATGSRCCARTRRTQHSPTLYAITASPKRVPARARCVERAGKFSEEKARKREGNFPEATAAGAPAEWSNGTARCCFSRSARGRRHASRPRCTQG